MRRRQFLIAGTAVVAAGAGAALWLKRGVTRKRDDMRLGDGAYTVIGALRGTDAVAQYAIDAVNGAPDPLVPIEKALIERLGIGNDLGISASNFAAKLADAVRDDYRQRRFCKGSAWLVSETECNVAALRLLVFGAAPAVDDSAEAELSEGKIVDVEDWGERSTEVNTPFAVQSDGHSGIWIKAKNAPPWVKFEIDGVRVRTFHSENAITTGLYGDLGPRVLSRVGEHPVALVDEMAGIRQPLGVFTVRPRAPRLRRPDGTVSELFCPVDAWGPDGTTAGTPANRQPDGSEGLWIKTACAPATARIVFGGVELSSTVRPGLVTAAVPLTLIGESRDVPVELRDRRSGETMAVGTFRIQAPGEGHAATDPASAR